VRKEFLKIPSLSCDPKFFLTLRQFEKNFGFFLSSAHAWASVNNPIVLRCGV